MLNFIPGVFLFKPGNKHNFQLVMLLMLIGFFTADCVSSNLMLQHLSEAAFAASGLTSTLYLFCIHVLLFVIIDALSLCIACMDCMMHSRNTPNKDLSLGNFLARHERLRRSEDITDLAAHVLVWHQLSLISSQWAKSKLSLSLAQV